MISRARALRFESSALGFINFARIHIERGNLAAISDALHDLESLVVGLVAETETSGHEPQGEPDL